jgi:predicted GNAT family acetyltransferase
MFLRSNARAAGLEYHGKPLQATYVGAFDRGRMVAVAAHCWNGVLLVQAPRDLGALTRFVLECSSRPLSGVSGPADQVLATLRALTLEQVPATKRSSEQLYALPLEQLVVPRALALGTLVCRRPLLREFDLLVEWRMAFMIDALGFERSPAMEREAREDIEHASEERRHWLLVDHDVPVSYAALNARLPDVVQIGGVWTPPDRRGRGYARAVTAGVLLEARSDGAKRGVLFTDNAAARRAYEAIGFRPVGEYGLVLFREPFLRR